MSQNPTKTQTQTKTKKDFDREIEELLVGYKMNQNEIKEIIEEITNNFDVPIKKMCSYGRVSTKSDEQESSLITQHILFKKYAEGNKSKGLVLVEEIYDQKTATLAIKRKKFLSMIERAKSGEFNVLLFKDSKRMCRNTTEFLDITEDLKRHNIACIFISEGVNSLTADRTTLTVLGMMAESHSNSLHDSVTIAKRINMERPEGRVPSYCFGYDKPKTNNSTEIYINQREADLTRELFERYVIVDEGVSTICDDWRARGIKSKLGNEVSTTMLNRMLRNRQYIGILDMGLSFKHDVRDKRNYKLSPSVVRERPDLQIVSDEIFLRAQEKIERLSFGKGHMQGINRRTVLTGKIQCNCCGKNFKRFWNGQGEKKALYYKCSTVKQTKRNAVTCECDNSSYFRKDEIMDSISVYFKEILTHQDELKKLIKNSVTNFFKNLEDNVDNNSLLLDIEKAQNEFKRYQNLYLEGLLEDMNLVKEKKKALDDLLNKQAILDKSTSSDFNIDSIVEKLFNNIEEFISIGLNNLENASDSTIIKFNSLFESIIATSDNRLIFNIKGSDEISTLANTNRNRVNAKCLCKNSLFSEEQYRILEEKQTESYFIPIESLFDYNTIYEEMNSIRNQSERTRRMYRYSERYRNLGNTLIDSVNIIL